MIKTLHKTAVVVGWVGWLESSGFLEALASLCTLARILKEMQAATGSTAVVCHQPEQICVFQWHILCPVLTGGLPRVGGGEGGQMHGHCTLFCVACQQRVTVVILITHNSHRDKAASHTYCHESTWAP